MEAHLANQTADTRFVAALLGSFAALGTVRALIGAYGVISYLVAQRSQELGVRLALGASPAAVLRLVLWSGLSMGLAGVALGLAGAVAVRRSLAGLLYGIAATDPVTLFGASAFLLVIVVTASGVPAIRAARIDPVRALRADC